MLGGVIGADGVHERSVDEFVLVRRGRGAVGGGGGGAGPEARGRDVAGLAGRRDAGDAAFTRSDGH